MNKTATDFFKKHIEFVKSVVCPVCDKAYPIGDHYDRACQRLAAHILTNHKYNVHENRYIDEERRKSSAGEEIAEYAEMEAGLDYLSECGDHE